MIKDIDVSLIGDMCFGGIGECHCSGTDTLAEKLLGPFKTIKNTPEECCNWCLNIKHGTEWKYYENHFFDILGLFPVITSGRSIIKT